MKRSINPILRLLIRWFIRLAIAFFVFFIVLVLILYLPPVQKSITKRIEKSLSDKFQSEIQIGTLHLNLRGDIILKDILIKNPSGEDVLRAGMIDVDLTFWPLFSGDIHINHVRIKDLKSYLEIDADSSTTNLDFIIHAFSKDGSNRPAVIKGWDLSVSEITILESEFSLNILRMLELEVELGVLKLLAELTDVNDLSFVIRDITVQDTNVSLRFFKDSLQMDEIPGIKGIFGTRPTRNVISEVRYLNAADLNFSMNLYDQFMLSTELPGFEGRNINFNLRDQLIAVSSVAIRNSTTEMSIVRAQAPASEEQTGLTWNEFFIKDFIWDISSGRTELENCSLKYDDNTSTDRMESIDPRHFDLRNIRASVTDAQVANQRLIADIHHLGFIEKKGFILRDLALEMKYMEDSLSLESIRFVTNNSQASLNLHLKSKGQESNLLYPEVENFNFDLRSLHIHSKDLDYLLKDNFLTINHIDSLELSLTASGKTEDIHISNLDLSINDKVSFGMTGQVQNVSNPEKICLRDLHTQARINSEFLLEVMDSLNVPQINLPDQLLIYSRMNGCLNDLHFESDLRSSMGDLYLAMDYRKPYADSRDSLSVFMKAIGFEIGQIFNIDSLGKINLRCQSYLTGLEDGPESFGIDMTLDTIYINQYGIRDIHLSSTFYDKDLDILLGSSDSLLDFNLGIHGQVLDSILDLSTDLEIRQMDLCQLGFIDDPFKVSTHIKSTDRIGKEFFEGTFQLPDLTITSTKTYSFDTINFYMFSAYDSISMNLHSRPLQGKFTTNIPIGDLGERMVDFYGYHFLSYDTISRPEATGVIDFAITSDVPLENLRSLVPDLEEFRFSRIEGRLNESDMTSSFKVFIPRITYHEITLDSLAFNMESSPENLTYNYNLPSVIFDDHTINNLNLSGRTVQGTVNNVLILRGNSLSPLLRIGFTIDLMTSDQLAFHLNPDSLIINSRLWNVLGDNEIKLVRNEGISGNIQVTDGQQSVSIRSSDTLYQVNITDLQLSNLNMLIQSFNPSFEISGKLNMISDIRLKDKVPKVIVDTRMTDFSFLKTSYGDIKISMENDMDNNISGELSLTHGDNNLFLVGKYDFDDAAQPINAIADINLNDLNVFNSFGNNFIEDPHGNIVGNLSVRGNKQNLNLYGKLDFKSVNFLLTPVNNRYQIDNESISVVDNQFNLGDFTLLDSAGNSFIMSGTVLFKPLNIFNMDLKLKADRFTFYNTTKSSNPNLYGKLIMSMNASVKGSTENPSILVNLSIDDGTNMIYALPPKNFDLVNSEGVVEFVDFSEEDTVQEINFKQHIGDTIFSKLNWLDLNAVLTIDKAAQFMIDMDPVSGDYIQFGGAGNLNFIVQQNQTPQVSGSYVFDRGIYEVSFYGLVKKTFRFQPGSRIAWSGDPFSASMNLKASYTIRTASVGLVSREIYGLPDEERNQYRRSLPYSVGISINGRLDEPLIGFDIDLPEEDKTAFPVVESKLNQINDPGHESELTRQVFGLLTIGSFIPETTGPGSTSSYGSALATTAAANSLNAILTGELNKLSGKYIKFVDLDIGMQTFSDMEGGGQTTRTTMDVRLSKRLFDDRVTIEAQGSFDLQNEARKYMHASDQSDVYSDFAVIYDLTEKGDYKLKAFQRSAYDIIYKNTQIGGVAVIFIKEFDKYREERKSDD